MRPVLDVGKEDDLTLDRREARERREQSRAEVGAFELVAGRVSAIRGNGVIEVGRGGGAGLVRSRFSDRRCTMVRSHAANRAG
jgi:hypothetical protein